MTAEIDRHYYDTRGGYGRVRVVEITDYGLVGFVTTKGDQAFAAKGKFGPTGRFHGPEPLDGEPWCCMCGKASTVAGGKTELMDACVVCKRDIHSRCELTIPGTDGGKAYDKTLCSVKCWEKAGKPSE